MSTSFRKIRVNRKDVDKLRTICYNKKVKMKNHSISISSFKGIPIINYNNIIYTNDSKIEINGKTYNGFYISYNDHDTEIYGNITTALVLGQMQKFYILNGDHSEEYKKIVNYGFNKCMEYFKNHINQINKYSDNP